ADINIDRAKEISKKHENCKATADWRDLVEDNDIDVINVATPNDLLAEITIAALKKGKHVLVEKPAGRSPQEIERIIKAMNGSKIKAGFNHRFHPAISKALHIMRTEDIGNIMFIRACYGHGARLNYNKEWRAHADIAGGGELIDQGVHVIDLIRYFTQEEFEIAVGFSENLFWDMEVEDNAFVLLKNHKNQVAQFHASCTSWKNAFSFEIFCKTGQININGLGRSYGTETLTFYKMKPEMGVPDAVEYSWPGDDQSWELEFLDLFDAIENDREPNGTIHDALESVKLVYKIYDWNKNFNKGG
nr:Gfo/Idh/MocA family oxidoreductase [Candidatus Sigynarchaeota archaeon]